MNNLIHVTVRCPKIGCPRSVSYCHICDDMKGIENDILACGWSPMGTKSARAIMNS